MMTDFVVKFRKSFKCASKDYTCILQNVGKKWKILAYKNVL